MAKQLESFAFTGRSNSATYDWKLFLNGKVWQLVQGEDFKCKVTTFATMARKQARIANLSLRTSTEGKTFTLQAVPKSDAAPASAPVDAPADDVKTDAKTPAPKRVSRSKKAAS